MIDTGAGVIDADYRGTVFILLFNFSEQDFNSTYSLCHQCFSDSCLQHVVICCIVVQEGDRIAQLIIEKIETPDVIEVDVRWLNRL